MTGLCAGDNRDSHCRCKPPKSSPAARWRFSSLNGRGRVNGCFDRILVGLRARVTDVCCFPLAADARGKRLAGSRTGRYLARPPEAVPQASLRPAGREPDEGWRETSWCIPGVFSWRSGSSRSRVCLSRAVPLAALTSLRAPGCWPGCMERVRVSGGRSGGVNQDSARAAGRRGREPGDLAPGRWPGKAAHAAAGCGFAGGGSAGVLARARISPSRSP
jgi:hypothetical protein